MAKLHYMEYKGGYKYQLTKDEKIKTSIRGYEIDTQFIKLSKDGWLLIRKGYAWDGPSGPTVDTFSSMRGSLVHDALYQLIREKHLPMKVKNVADRLLKAICIADGMWKWRAWVWLKSMGTTFAKKATKVGRTLFKIKINKIDFSNVK